MPEDPDAPSLVWACEPFATVDDFFACPCDCLADPDDADHVALIERALAAASDELAILSGHSVRGICEQTVEFCRSCGCGLSLGCGCGLDTVYLPGPIVAVTDVSWDGYGFVDTDFQIVNDHWLSLTDDVDGNRRYWPAGVDVSVTYTFGTPIDEIAKRASIELACAAVKACISDACNIGQNPGSVSRQGITIVKRQVSAVAGIAEQAASQYPWMARFLTLYNPDRASHVPFLYSADLDDLRVIRALTP